MRCHRTGDGDAAIFCAASSSPARTAGESERRRGAPSPLSLRPWRSIRYRRVFRGRPSRAAAREMFHPSARSASSIRARSSDATCSLTLSPTRAVPAESGRAWKTHGRRRHVLRIGKHGHPFHQIGQLSHVARPRVGLKGGFRVRSEDPGRKTVFGPHGSPDAHERLERENERLRRELAERERQLKDAERQVADAKKQIADLERQLALRQQNSTTTSKPPSSDGLAGRQRERGRRTKSRRKPAVNRGIPGICGRWCRSSA